MQKPEDHLVIQEHGHSGVHYLFYTCMGTLAPDTV